MTLRQRTPRTYLMTQYPSKRRTYSLVTAQVQTAAWDNGYSHRWIFSRTILNFGLENGTQCWITSIESLLTISPEGKVSFPQGRNGRIGLGTTNEVNGDQGICLHTRISQMSWKGSRRPDCNPLGISSASMTSHSQNSDWIKWEAESGGLCSMTVQRPFTALALGSFPLPEIQLSSHH